jgi:hypothetical protein
MKKTTSTKEKTTKEFAGEISFKATRKLVKSRSAVMETTDYDMFDSTIYSRVIYPNHVSKIAKDIGIHEQLMPIIVVKIKDGNSILKYRILEGHHRWHAAQKVGAPLIYMVYEFVDAPAEMEFYVSVNAVSKRLTDADYLRMGVMLGIPSYVKIEKIRKDNDFTFLDMSTLHGNLKGNEKFKNGTFVLEPEEEKRILTKIKQLKEITKCHPHVYDIYNYDKQAKKALKASILRIVREPLYNHKKMLQKINLYHTKINRMSGKDTSNAVDFTIQLSSIYNKGEKDKVRFSLTNN